MTGFKLGLLFLCLVTLAHAFYNPVHPSTFRPLVHRLQADPSTACMNWISSQQGFTFIFCFLDLIQLQPNASNNCQIDYSTFCGGQCYKAITDGFDYLAKSGVCSGSDLPGNDDDDDSPFTSNCTANPGNCGSSETCINDNCMTLCNTTADCPPDFFNDTCGLYTYECTELDGSTEKVCKIPDNSIDIMPDVIVTDPSKAMLAASYTFKFLCAKDSTGDYCLNLFQQYPNVTTAPNCNVYGCCLGTASQMYQYCYGGTPNATSIGDVTSCPNLDQTCPPLPTAKSYCSANGAEKLSLSLLVIVSLIFTSLWAM